MVSYVVTGANRGLGLALVQILHARCTSGSSNALQGDDLEDRIFALVRDLNSCNELKKLVDPNVHIISGDLDNPETLHVETTLCLLS